MRRVKARVCITKEGKVGEAYTENRLLADLNENYAEEVEGYIEVPLKKGTSRAKGNGLEIVVAKAFSKWLYGREDVLKRTPLSGGWGSGKLGDITLDPYMATALSLPQPRLYVECKNRDGVLDEAFWRYMATGKPCTIADWIVDTVQKAGDMPSFLVLKGRATDPWVAFLSPGQLFVTVSAGLGMRIAAPIKSNPQGLTVVRDVQLFPLSRLHLAMSGEDAALIRNAPEVK